MFALRANLVQAAPAARRTPWNEVSLPEACSSCDSDICVTCHSLYNTLRAVVLG